MPKTFLTAKTFRAYSTNYLRREKSLRDRDALGRGCGCRVGVLAAGLGARSVEGEGADPARRLRPPLTSTLTFEYNAKRPTPKGRPLHEEMCGGVLLSREASLAVPSALRGLTSGFGMGPGVSPSLWPPQLYGNISLMAPGRIPGTA